MDVKTAVEGGAKQRVVGAMVLFAMMVILLSWIYEDPSRQAREFNIPEAPLVSAPAQAPAEQEAQRAKQQELAAQDRLAAHSDVVTQSPAKTPSAKVKPAILDEQGLPRAWVLRLGSFSKAANANALQTKLRAAGHKAYIRQIKQSSGREFAVVYVGPLLDAKRAKQLLTEVEQSFKLKGALVDYKP